MTSSPKATSVAASDDKEARARRALQTERRLGLFIGIDRYPGLRTNLRFASSDVQDLVALFRQIAPVSEARILINEEATRFNVLSAMADISRKAKRDDQVWLYFSGVGFQYQNAGYLALTDAVQPNLQAGSLPVDEVVSWTKSLTAKQVLVMADACHSGLATHKGTLVTIPLSKLVDMEGRVWIAAGSANELAFEDEKLGHGTLTNYILRGLAGEADAFGNGYITAYGLFSYVVQGVLADPVASRSQHPWYEALDGSGDFVIAEALHQRR